MCERGIRTFNDYTRNTMDIAAIPIIKQETGLKVIADPSMELEKAKSYFANVP